MKPLQWSQHALDVVTSRIPPPEQSLPVASGIISFGTTLAASTWTQKILGLSTGSVPPIPTLTGVVTVCAAACISHKVALFVQQEQQQQQRHQQFFWRPSSMPTDTSGTVVTIGSFRVTNQMIRVCLVGMIAFKVLGGRFWAVAPSSFTHLGSFARGSLPASEKYATPLQRVKLERMGRIFGCHTCGSRRLFQKVSHQFVGDHMPPKAVADQMNRSAWRRATGRSVRFRFFPQCVVCSSRQGSLLSAATQRLKSMHGGHNHSARIRLAGVGGGHQAYFHGWRPRTSHLTGGLVAAAALIDPDLETIEKWSRQVGHKVQSFFENNRLFKR